MLVDSEEEEEKEFLNQKAQWMKSMDIVQSKFFNLY